MIKVAVTGGLACGKSSVCHFFEDLGARVVSADSIVHKLLTIHTPEGQATIALLGSDIVANGQISRTKIASKVFQDKTWLSQLEALLHPAVREEIDRNFEKAENDATTKLFVVEIPLLFESEWHRDFDKTVAVVADKEVCQRRYISKSGDEQTFERRLKQQMPTQDKAKKADYVLTNNGTLEELKIKTKKLYQTLISL